MDAYCPYDDPITAIAPAVWFHAETAELAEREGRLGMAAQAVCDLYHDLHSFRKRDAFFLAEWHQADGPSLLAVPEDALERLTVELQHVRAARLALFALLERMGYPYRLGYRWPIDPDEGPLWEVSE